MGPRTLFLAVVGILFAATVAAFPFVWHMGVENRYSSQMYTIEKAITYLPSDRVAVVFGARVYRSGRLSAMLRDRVDTAVQLYRTGLVDQLLVSGDNSSADYNEPDAMMAYAIAQGVDPADIQPDYAGRRTYDTCYRAREIFQLDAAVLVTQEFHLPRALFTCNSLGVDSVGVIADRRDYDPRSIAWSESREVPALLLALVDVIRRLPPPVLGEPIPLQCRINSLHSGAAFPVRCGVEPFWNRGHRALIWRETVDGHRQSRHHHSAWGIPHRSTKSKSGSIS